MSRNQGFDLGSLLGGGGWDPGEATDDTRMAGQGTQAARAGQAAPQQPGQQA
jgi:hypothetical protein